MVEQFHDCLCQRLLVSSFEQDTGLVVFDEFSVAANIRSNKKLALGHGFQRLEWRDKFGQAHRVARVGEDVDQVVITVDLAVRHATGEDDVIPEAELFGLLSQIGFLRSAADE